MDGQAQVKPDPEDDVPDYDIVEEGSAEAKALAQGGKVEDDDEADESDATLARGPAQDRDDVARTADQIDAATKKRNQRHRLKEKLDQKDGLIDSLRQQLRDQAGRLDMVERRTGSNEIAMIDKAISDTGQLVDMLAHAHSQALLSNDPGQVTRAMNDLFDARNNLNTLQNAKQNAIRQSTAPKATNPRVATNVSAWMARNSWFRPETNDEDSRIAKILDDKVAEDGFDPTTSAYWAELDRRIKKRLPHRALRSGKKDEVEDMDEDDEDPQPDTREREGTTRRQGRSNVSGAGASGGAGGGRQKVVLSSQRVKALKDAGKWDDPVERNKMVRQYMKYDRDNAAQS